MSIRILHTADNHIGLSFSRYPEAARERLIEERFKALERLIALANQRKAHFFVVSGDLFDRQTIPKKMVRRTAEILGRFEGDLVLVLAGNHDFYEGPDNALWRSFREVTDGARITLLLERRSLPWECGETRVVFHACPCPSKHGKESEIGWVAEAEKSAGSLHIGLAHGNVAGLGLDAEQQYFNMTEAGLRAAGVHTWLLGHIHVPAPHPGTSGLPLFFMPGTHTPDSVKCSHPGHAWWIELDAQGNCHHELLSTGGVRFVRLRRELSGAGDWNALRQECEALDAPNTVLDLQLAGRLPEPEIAALRDWIDSKRSGFLDLSHVLDIQPLLDASAISKKFPEGTLPHALLTELLADAEHPGDAHLALEIIESIQRP